VVDVNGKRPLGFKRDIGAAMPQDRIYSYKNGALLPRDDPLTPPHTSGCGSWCISGLWQGVSAVVGPLLWVALGTYVYLCVYASTTGWSYALL
jgi:hypothetical protein